MSHNERFLSAIEGKRGRSYSATIWRFADGEKEIVETIHASDQRTERQLGQQAVREHVRRAILLS